jgi:hypothetical protein
LKNVDRLRVRQEWKDGTGRMLEDQPNDIVAHNYLAGEALKEQRLADERAAIAKREREIREWGWREHVVEKLSPPGHHFRC